MVLSMLIAAIHHARFVRPLKRSNLAAAVPSDTGRWLRGLKGRYTRGSLLLQPAHATRSRSKAPSSAPTISREKICCATNLLLPSFAPEFQTGLIWGSTLQGQICCTILFQEQAPSCALKFALRERVSGASSFVCTGWGTYVTFKIKSWLSEAQQDHYR